MLVSLSASHGNDAWVDEMKSAVESVPLQDFLERLKD